MKGRDDGGCGGLHSGKGLGRVGEDRRGGDGRGWDGMG